MGRKWIEKRKRGVFGWLFLSLFWLWNAFMAFAVPASLGRVARLGESAMTDAERAGHDIGAGIGITMLLVLWAVGAVVLGLLAHFSRGKREMIEFET